MESRQLKDVTKLAATQHIPTVAKWVGAAVLIPVMLFLVSAALLYAPPIQNWVAKKVTAIASEKTGMEITVGHVSLEWPLDLGIDDFQMLHQNDSLPQVTDTIADVSHLTLDIRILPLFGKRVVINELSLQQARINTNGFISDVRIKGNIGELWLLSEGIDLDTEKAVVNGTRLAQSAIDIALSDTAAVDTTESAVKWIIDADRLTFIQSSLLIHLTGDTLNVKTYFEQAIAYDARIDLDSGTYQVGKLSWRGGSFNYDDRWEPSLPGFDYSHIAMSDVSLDLDSFTYAPAGTSLYIRQAAMKEKCGLEIAETSGGIKFDPDFNSIQIPALHLKTPDSDIFTEMDMHFTTFDDQPAGGTNMHLDAQLGKQDIIKFIGDLPQRFMQGYPNHPLIIKGLVNGNMDQMTFEGFYIHLPTAFQANANGTISHFNDLSRLKADISLNAKSQNLSFVTTLLDPKTAKDYHIPDNLSVDGNFKADGTNYTTTLTAREGSGSIKLEGKALIPLDVKGNYVTELMTYDAVLDIDDLNLHHFMPNDSLYTLTADVKANGYGTDLFSARSHLTADAVVSQLRYGHWDLNNMTATALLQDGRGQASIIGHNHLFDGSIGIDALLSTSQFKGTVSTDIARADLFRMRIVSDTLTIGVCGNLDIASDMKQSHRVSGLLSSLYIRDEKTTYRPKDIGLLLNTTCDTTYLRAQSGDFIVKLDAEGGCERLFEQAAALTDSVMSQFEDKVIDQPAIKRLLPTLRLHLESKRDNPVASFLKTYDITFREMLIDLTTSPLTGINGKSYLYSLNYDSTRIDTIRLDLTQKGDRLTYQGQIRNNRHNPQFVFNALLDGHVHQHGILAGLRYYDGQKRLGVRIGATADMEKDGIRLRLMPERPTVGYKEFNLNTDNYIFLGAGNKIQAKVDLIADDRTGLKFYTENQDSTMLQDLTVSINQFDLGELTSVMPYLPRITGKLNGDFHILQDGNRNFSVASDMAVQAMTFEGSPVGNVSTELVYLMREDDTHAVEARLMLDDEEFGLLSGNYHSGGDIDATFSMTHFPLSLANGFIPDQIVGLEGFGEGQLTIKGTTSHPQVDGEVFVEDAYLVSSPYGVRLRFDNDPIRVVGSHLLLENFGLYAYNDEPLNTMGDIDFSDTDNVNADIRMRARNLLLINAKQEQKSITFGKAFVNFYARLQGPLEQLRMRGKLDVLGSTNMTYMLLDSPLSTDNRLDELVKFTDFSDTTQVVVTRPTPTGFEADLTISISQGARVVCNLNVEQTNYIDLTGGGDLRMKYNSEGIDLKGRYTLSDGHMKYSMPVIPLKTFTIKEGSYVEFSGDPTNPKLNITATERTKSTVSQDGTSSRSITFECGVVITKTLNDMGLEFTIDAPDDKDISSELQSMSAEERGKTAVTMLTTGIYLVDGNTKNLTMNSALSSFLQSEINSITGSALRTLDVSVGIENSTAYDGSTHTDYSFRFAKRFLNNRLKVEIGGKVSSGANYLGQTQSFFDNVTMEYRLNQDATQNLKLFYDQNVYDWLDGYTSQYGIGFIWRRKAESFWDIFRFRQKEQPPVPVRQPSTRPDNVTTDSLKTNHHETK